MQAYMHCMPSSTPSPLTSTHATATATAWLLPGSAAAVLARLLPGVPHKGAAPACLHSALLSQLCSASPQPPQPAPPAAAQRLLRHAVPAQRRQPAASADVPRAVEQLPAGSHCSAWEAQLRVGAAACHASAGVQTS
jgi:hypothetical protein